MITRCTAIALVATFALSGPAEARDASAPVTRTTDAADVLHGVRVADPYRWLEDGQNAEVQAWTEAQSKRTRAYLDSLPFRAPLRAKLETLTKQASPRYVGLDATGGQLFAVYSDPKFQQPMIVVMGQDADPTKARVVLDPNKLDPTGGTSFDWFEPSPDGQRIAVSLSKGGSEDGSLYVFDVATGRQVGEAIPRVQYPTAGGDVAWTPDGKGFWYTRYPGPDRPADEQHFHQTVWLHRLGEDQKTDVQVFGDGLPKVAEIRLDYSDEADALLVTVQKGDGGEFAALRARRGRSLRAGDPLRGRRDLRALSGLTARCTSSPSAAGYAAWRDPATRSRNARPQARDDVRAAGRRRDRVGVPRRGSVRVPRRTRVCPLSRGRAVASGHLRPDGRPAG